MVALEAEAEMFPTRRELKDSQANCLQIGDGEAEMFPTRRELKEVES